MESHINYRGSREELRTLLRSFVASLSGQSGEFAPYVRGIKLRVGLVALSCIQESFLAKSAGGAGEDGIQWDPLKKATIAARRVGPGDIAGLKSQGITKRKFGFGARKQGASDLDSAGRLKRGFLTAAQDKRWRTIFATRKASLMAAHGMGEEAASARAGQIAWATLKAEGAKTKLDVLGNRSVMIGRDTGRLFNSLAPGTPEPESHPLLQEAPPVEERVLRDEPGAIVIGSDVDYAAAFHAKRPLWPASDLPEAWSQRIAEAGRTGIEEAITMILGSRQARSGAA